MDRFRKAGNFLIALSNAGRVLACARMRVSIQIPIRQYDIFVKTINPSSPAAEVLKNAGYHRETKNGRFERTMEISCTADELKMLVQLATRHCPEVTAFFRQGFPRRELPQIN